MRLVVDGDVGSFQLLMRRHNQRLYRTSRSILRNDGEAEDAVHQAWLLRFTRLSQFAGRARFSPWMTRIAVNQSLGRLPAQRRS